MPPVDRTGWGQSYWRALYYFNLYRLILGVGFLVLALSGGAIAELGARSARVFLATSIGMTVMAVFNMITITRGEPRFRTQAHIQFAMDAVLITMLSYASGGIGSGLNLLLIVSVAAGGVVLSGRMSLFFAALSTLLALAEHTVGEMLFPLNKGSYVEVGLLGIGYFGTGLLVYLLALRIRRAEAMAERSAADLAKLARLNELVVSRLTMGVIVVDADGGVKLINETARRLLDVEMGTDVERVEQLSTPLYDLFREWRGVESTSPDSVSLPARGRNVGARFLRIGTDVGGDTAIFLEDLTATEQQAQQLKLTALGRLTAALAHEIRNPLAAISHAGQLLQESPELAAQDRRLAQIVDQQTDRINRIVKSILQLGKPGSVRLIDIDLDNWLREFRANFAETHRLDEAMLSLSRCGYLVRFDPDHLNQVVSNLCENALRHGGGSHGGPPLRLHAGRDATGVYLDVIDNGPGVAADVMDKIFEPFFSTDGKGMGLGLYLARELCQNNHGRLDYVPADGEGRFRIRFSSEVRAAHKLAMPI